ncbi:inactive tyrosine-protein kinase PEAK1 isoform X1 [Thamnophis elegans]|uniref:inactive tyrosine-protein kinase PEAK1 isoform X1 n=1 Tax=Thamnophis elegans TaxID=35005 RepID=UPI0013778B68|nr:inactive tyrosine-protein kinase PEAK1 isoform X1 [Thamnophis elegans]XP_032088496.1 inactive tyrosine-protein kinase PEAK1 isoform X1 [Thamnophis elegans]
MSACNAFTEHVWKPGECKNCFKPKNLHQTPPGPEKAPVSNSNIKTNAIHSNQHNKNTGNFRPPVAKKPTIAVKPTMVTIDGQGMCGEITSQDLCENKPALVGWNQNITALKKKPLNNNNNNEEEEEEEVENYSHIHRSFGNNDDTDKAPSNNNGLTDVLKEIAGLDHSTFLTRNEINSREVFLGRINTCYKKSLERKVPPSCLMDGTKSQNKHVVLSGTTAVISSEGGRFCYPEFSSGDESEDDLFFGSIHDDHESWDESDEELLAMEIRMRGQPRFANFRANTLSPVRFCVDKKWNTVPLRHKSLQRFCAVDYDDSYDEILNGYGDDPVILFGPEGVQSMVSSDSMSPDSSLTEESHSGTASSSSQKLCNGRVSPNSPKGSRLMGGGGGDNRFSDDQQVKVSIKNTQNTTQIVETHKAVLAVRLEEKDSKSAIPSDKQEWKSSLNTPVQTTTTNLIPVEEQAKPYRVVNMEQPVCKPYTIVDVSAAMTHESIANRAKNLDTRYIRSNPNSPDPLSTNAIPQSVSCGQVTPNLKKSNTARYQEVWTSSTSPRQKIAKVELTANVPGPSVPIRRNILKSAPTSPTSTHISTKTIPVKSPNLSEIKFNSYNNAGMPPFPIIIHDEPTYARCSKNAIKVPIVINPNAYDNLAIYKSFLGTNGELSFKDKTTSIISHTYEEIETGSTVSENIPTRSAELPQAKGSGSNTERRLGSVAQKVQEFNSCLGKGQASPKMSCRGSPTKIQRTFQESSAEVDDNQEISNGGRENACAVLSQIVASIQPPQSPPEAPQPGPKSCSVEELYSLPPDADPDKSTSLRPKSLFSVQPHPNAEGIKSTEVASKEIPSKSPIVQPSKPMALSPSPKTEQAPPFPPPRSTSSPYHASKVLQKHFGNWSKPLSPSRSTEAESVLHSEGRRAVDAKPKRWISFKSFFRRRKTEEEEDREREKGKLVGLDGTVIHMLPPPPVERHNWFSESRSDSSEKPSVVFMFKCDQAKLETKTNQTKTEVEPTIEVITAERGETENHPETPEESLKSHPSSPQLPKEILSQVPDEKTKPVENVSPPIPISAFEKQDVDSPTFYTPEILQLEDEREEMSDSSDVSACSATYSNLGQSRAKMMPPKRPRQLKGALEDAIVFGGISDPEISAIFHPTPPPLPKKTILRAHTEPLPKDLQKQAVESSLCVMANPTYDINTNWEGSSICSSVSSDFKAVDNESGDSLGRAPEKAIPSTTNLAAISMKSSGSTSTESVSVRPVAHSKQGKAGPKPHQLYRGIENREEVVNKIRSLHADSLKKLSARCEDLFMAGQKNQLRFGVDSWSDFRLTSDRPCCEAGDAVYYPASYAKDSLNNYAVKICKSRAKESQQYYHSLAIRQSLAIHFNIQQDCGHFLADVPVRLLPWEDPDSAEEEDEAEQKSEESSSPLDNSQDSPGPQSTFSKQRSRVVVITREVPYLSVADFVQNSVEHHSRCPDLYERQVCLLLLQLCSGLEHLKPYHITHCDLRLENLLLVGCRASKSLLNPDLAELNPGAACPTRLLVSNFSQAKQKSHMVDPEILKDQSRLAPEIITAMQYKKCDEFQTGILIYEMLHLPNPFDENPELKEKEYTWADLPQVPRRSLYSLGLQKLAACLLNPNPSERILISEAKSVLQCLLWGPREDLFQSLRASTKPSQREAVLQNWLDIKRTLLMIKFAEKSLDKECQVSLEDWLCCQYLAFATIDSLSRIVKIMRQH